MTADKDINRKGMAKNLYACQFRAKAVFNYQGVFMNLGLKKLSGLILVAMVASTASSAMARNFRSADVHAKDFPTN